MQYRTVALTTAYQTVYLPSPINGMRVVAVGVSGGTVTALTDDGTEWLSVPLWGRVSFGKQYGGFAGYRAAIGLKTNVAGNYTIQFLGGTENEERPDNTLDPQFTPQYGTVVYTGYPPLFQLPFPATPACWLKLAVKGSSWTSGSFAFDATLYAGSPTGYRAPMYDDTGALINAVTADGVYWLEVVGMSALQMTTITSITAASIRLDWYSIPTARPSWR